METQPTNQPATTGSVRAEELLPCPFCGGEAEMEKIGTARQSMIIACTNCGTHVESGDVRGLTQPKHYKWNTRHTRLPAYLAAVDKALAAWELQIRVNPLDRMGQAMAELRALQQQMK